MLENIYEVLIFKLFLKIRFLLKVMTFIFLKFLEGLSNVVNTIFMIISNKDC